MLPDEMFEPSPGMQLRVFSIAHLRCQNPAARLAPLEVAEKLMMVAVGSPEWKFSELARVFAGHLRRTFGDPTVKVEHVYLEGPAPGAFDGVAERELIEAAIRVGLRAGLGAAWGVSTEAELFWAGAAHLTHHFGRDHPNEI
jgi:hypothetical protein